MFGGADEDRSAATPEHRRTAWPRPGYDYRDTESGPALRSSAAGRCALETVHFPLGRIPPPADRLIAHDAGAPRLRAGAARVLATLFPPTSRMTRLCRGQPVGPPW